MKVRILQAKASRGARSLVENLRGRGLNALRTKVHGSRYLGYSSHLIVNWGRSEYPSRWSGVPLLNKPESVRDAVDKVRTFKVLSQAGLTDNLPLWTEDMEDAKSYLRDQLTDAVYCRLRTSASGGAGIHLARVLSELRDARLFTGRVVSSEEYRVHVWTGDILDFSQKKKMSSETREERGFEGEPDEFIRSHSNGWIFAREGISVSDSMRECAISAVSALGLDFGAVDMLLDEEGVPKILEVNTAPGLEGTTLEKYTSAINNLARSL
jgi:hypothetical protein